MDSIQVNPTAALGLSFEKLKKEARSLEDVKAWFLQNHEILVSPVQGEVAYLNAWVHPRNERDYMLIGGPKSPKIDEIFYQDQPEHSLGLCIYLQIKSAQEDNHPFLSQIGLRNTRVSTGNLQEQWTMPITLSDWSFLVALSASSYMMNQSRGSTAEHVFLKVQRAFLENELPRHFPGITLDNMQALHATGILENISYTGMINFLFANRTSAQVDMRNINDLSLPMHP